MTTHRIGIIGIGAIAGMHARAISDIDNATLVGGCCRTEEKGRKFCDEHGGDWYPDYEQLLDQAKPDVVTICTPSGAHLEPVKACAQRGIHVICEKPLEISTARVDEMIAAAKAGGITLGGIFPQRFNPVMRTLQEAAAAGRFGNLATVNSYVPWWRDDEYYAPSRWQGTLALDGGGAMMNQSIHGVDMLQWIAGSAIKASGYDLADNENPVEQIFAFTATRGHDEDLIEVEDTAVAVVKFRGGALGQLLGTTSMYPGALRRFQIGGRDGTAKTTEDELTAFKFREEREGDQAIRDRFAAETKSGGGASDPMAIDYANHTRNIKAILDAIDGKAELELDGHESRKAVAIIEALYQSAKTGKVVTL